MSVCRRQSDHVTYHHHHRTVLQKVSRVECNIDKVVMKLHVQLRFIQTVLVVAFIPSKL